MATDWSQVTQGLIQGVDGVASHPPPFTCSFVQDAMGIGLAMLDSHPLQ